MELTGDLLTAAIYDALIFCVEIIALIYIVLRRHLGFERVVMLFYGLVTLSAYNLYIQVIHDFNIPIARTALFKIHLFGPIYIFDGVVIAFCAVIIFRYLFGKGQLSLSKQIPIRIGYQLYFRDFALYMVSFFAFIIFSINGHLVDLGSQIRPARGVVMGALFMWLFVKMFNGIKDSEHSTRIIYTLVLLDIINVVGELLSAPYFGKYLWDRGGHKVALLDQANSFMAICYLPLLFWWKPFGRIPSIFGFVIMSLLLYDFTKGLFFFVPLALFVFTLVSFMRGRISRRLLIPLCIAPLLVAAVLPGIAQDRAIKGTRGIQLEAYFDFISTVPTAILWGSGVGGMYPVLQDTEDKGEMKEVDRDEVGDSQYQVQFQVPIVFYFKIAGLLGVFIVIAGLVGGLRYAYLVIAQNRMAGFFVITAIVLSIIVPPFLNPDPNEIVYFCRLLFMAAILVKFFSTSGNLGSDSNGKNTQIQNGEIK